MSYLIFLLLFISALLWLTTNDSFTDKGAAVVFSWMIAPAFVILLIALGKMTPTDLAIVAGGGGAVIPLVIAGVRKLIAFAQQSNDKHTSTLPITKKITQKEAETIAMCEAMRADMDKQIASTLQNIEQLKAQQAHFQNVLNQASKELALLQVSFDHHLAHIHQQLSTIIHATAKRDQLLQETQAQKSILSSTKRGLDALKSQVTNKRFKYALQNLEAKHKKANQRQDRLQEQLAYLKDDQNTVWYGDIQEVERQTNNYEKVLEKVASDVYQLVEETEKLSNKINNLPDQNQLLVLANQRLTTTLKTMQDELTTLRTHFHQQQRAYQPASLEKQAVMLEGLEQKQALYTQIKRAYQEAQQALTDHMTHLWTTYDQHNPQQPTQDIKVLNAFMRQHFPQEMELFRKKRERRSLTQAKYEAIKKELKAFTKEMDKLQLAAALANNTEESINQLWQSYTLSDDPEEFWQAYEQRLQTLDGWRQAVYLLK